MLKVLKQCGVSLEEMVSGKVKVVYQKVVEKVNEFDKSPRWALLHYKILPNYLISFNYKVHYNLLPVRAKFLDFQLDNMSRCAFCNINHETIFHIMGKCTKLHVLWDFMNELMALLMGIDYDFYQKRTSLQEFEVMNIKSSKSDIKVILYLTSIINYHLWKARNRAVHDGIVFDCNDIVSRLIKSVGARKRLQLNINKVELKVDRLPEIMANMIFLHNLTFVVDPG